MAKPYPAIWVLYPAPTAALLLLVYRATRNLSTFRDVGLVAVDLAVLVSGAGDPSHLDIVVGAPAGDGELPVELVGGVVGVAAGPEQSPAAHAGEQALPDAVADADVDVVVGRGLAGPDMVLAPDVGHVGAADGGGGVVASGVGGDVAVAVGKGRVWVVVVDTCSDFWDDGVGESRLGVVAEVELSFVELGRGGRSLGGVEWQRTGVDTGGYLCGREGGEGDLEESHWNVDDARDDVWDSGIKVTILTCLTGNRYWRDSWCRYMEVLECHDALLLSEMACANIGP